MNDCLQQPRAGRQSAGPQLQRNAALFEQAFAVAPDLTHLSRAARRILAMSAALFHRQGAAATSIRDITSACGLSPGALYKHFSSKDDVLYQLVLHGHERLDGRIVTAWAGVVDTPLERTAAFVRAYVRGHLESPQLAQLVRREYLHLTPERYDEIVRRRRSTRTQLTTLLEAGQRCGCFHLIDGPESATRTAVMVLDMCSRTSEWYQPDGSTPPEDLTERYVQASLRLAGADLQHACT